MTDVSLKERVGWVIRKIKTSKQKRKWEHVSEHGDIIVLCCSMFSNISPWSVKLSTWLITVNFCWRAEKVAFWRNWLENPWSILWKIYTTESDSLTEMVNFLEIFQHFHKNSLKYKKYHRWVVSQACKWHSSLYGGVVTSSFL